MHLLFGQRGLMAAIDLTGQLRDWVAKAIKEACMGEDFGYETAWALKPPRLTYTVVITMPNPLLGQGPVVMPFSLPVGSLDEDTVRAGVHHVMGELCKIGRQLLEGPPQRASAPHN
jgi:hypothetical protein